MYEIVQKRSRKANENLPLPLIARQNNKNSFENLREFIVIKIVIVITFIRFIILRFLQFLIRVSNRNSLSLSLRNPIPQKVKKKKIISIIVSKERWWRGGTERQYWNTAADYRTVNDRSRSRIVENPQYDKSWNALTTALPNPPPPPVSRHDTHGTIYHRPESGSKVLSSVRIGVQANETLHASTTPCAKNRIFPVTHCITLPDFSIRKRTPFSSLLFLRVCQFLLEIIEILERRIEERRNRYRANAA